MVSLIREYIKKIKLSADESIIERDPEDVPELTPQDDDREERRLLQQMRGEW